MAFHKQLELGRREYLFNKITKAGQTWWLSVTGVVVEPLASGFSPQVKIRVETMSL